MNVLHDPLRAYGCLLIAFMITAIAVMETLTARRHLWHWPYLLLPVWAVLMSGVALAAAWKYR